MSDKSILYVTSFAQDMYQMTGQKLINTFLKFQTESDQRLLICYENFDYQPPLVISKSGVTKVDNRILCYNLSHSQYLQQWLSNNQDIIPDYLGGKATKVKKPKIFNSYWNRKASRWFRKIAALEYALRTYGAQYHYLVWLDSDVQLISTLPTSVIKKQFLDKTNKTEVGAFCHFGQFRRKKDTGIESGVIGFQLDYGGYPLLQRVIKVFQDGSFRKYPRWDDGYIFRMVMLDHNPKPYKYMVRDLIQQSTNSTEVISVGPLKKYLSHKKGTHARKKIIK